MYLNTSPGDKKTVHASATLSATGANTTECLITYAKLIEVIITVTAAAGGGDFTFNAQTGLSSAAYATDTDWCTQKTRANLTAAGTYTMLLNREEVAFMDKLRIAWTKNAGTSITASVQVIVRE